MLENRKIKCPDLRDANGSDRKIRINETTQDEYLRKGF